MPESFDRSLMDFDEVRDIDEPNYASNKLTEINMEMKSVKEHG